MEPSVKIGGLLERNGRIVQDLRSNSELEETNKSGICELWIKLNLWTVEEEL